MKKIQYNMMADFIDSFGSNEYFAFASDMTGTINSPSDRSDKLFIEKTIFGKKISNVNVKPAITKNMWTAGTYYTQYDDTIDYTDKTYYCIVVNDSTDYEVYKCISNNNGGPSTEKPSYVGDISLQNFMVSLSDGYKWKYMYKVTATQATSYNTSTLFPVIIQQEVVDDAKTSIDNIVVVNLNNNIGYETQQGIIRSLSTVSTQTFITLESEGFNQTSGYYIGYSLYVTSSTGASSMLYHITDSGVNISTLQPYVVISGYVPDSITNISTSLWTAKIQPTVDIIGDGVGAVAIPVVQDSKITNINIINSGQDYTRAIARIIRPSFGFSESADDIECVLRVIISPSGGHGYNPAYELGASHLIMPITFENTDDIPSSNTYSKVGLVKNPEFVGGSVDSFDNRIRIELTSVDQINASDIITQPTTNFYGIVHEVDVINNYIYITEFLGPYNTTSSQYSYMSGLVPLDNNQPITTSFGRIEIVPSGILMPSYNHMTGEVISTISFDPIERGNTTSEQFKFIISF